LDEFIESAHLNDELEKQRRDEYENVVEQFKDRSGEETRAERAHERGKSSGL
jgi:hypothetical protein